MCDDVFSYHAIAEVNCQESYESVRFDPIVRLPSYHVARPTNKIMRVIKKMAVSAALKAMARLFASAWDRHYVRSFRAGRCGGSSDLGLCGAGRDAAKRVAWVGVAAWDVGLDWMLTCAFVLALAWFGLVLVAVRIVALFGARVRAQARHAL